MLSFLSVLWAGVGVFVAVLALVLGSCLLTCSLIEFWQSQKFSRFKKRARKHLTDLGFRLHDYDKWIRGSDTVYLLFDTWEHYRSGASPTRGEGFSSLKAHLKSPSEYRDLFL